jgi:hypothetical protein
LLWRTTEEALRAVSGIRPARCTYDPGSVSGGR